MLFISSFNVNSIKARLEIVKNYIIDNNIDVLLLQEIKCQNENFPIEEFENLGYQVEVSGQKSYNGVAVISKYPIEVVASKFFQYKSEYENQARFLDVKILDYRLISVYVPNGNPLGTIKYLYKLKWLDEFYTYCKKLYNTNEKVIIGGDFNVIQQDLDCYDTEVWINDALFTEDVKKIFKRILNIGFADCFRVRNLGKRSYTFWDYQNGAWQKDNGIRIDLFLLSPETLDLIQDCGIDKSLRSLQRPSDHTPIWIKLNN